jgi:hypothetical protein
MLEMIEQQKEGATSPNKLPYKNALLDETEDVLSQDSLETVSDDSGFEEDDSDSDHQRKKPPPMSPSDELTTSASHAEDVNQKDPATKQFKEMITAKDMDVAKYMAKREMTPFQERMNAVTVMPGAFFCIMFLLSGSWLSPSFVEEHGYTPATSENFDESQCLSWTWTPHMHAPPPLPLMAAAFGIIAHAPFSFIYHWKYAHRLPAGLPRTNHWSRRMDQVMIHFCSGLMAYATSGRWDFFLANALFNMDCIYRQFIPKVHPRRNQMRIFISVLAYTIPLLRRGDVMLFAKLWLLFSISGWLFGMYPIGGWSHSVFHIVMAFVPPLLMTAALELPASHGQLQVAAQCAVLAKDSLVS